MQQSRVDKAAYAIEKPLDGVLSLARRVADGQLYLGRPLNAQDDPSLRALVDLEEQGGGAAVASAFKVLNHDNLVGAVGPVTVTPVAHGPRDEAPPQPYLLWDWCDAGSLETLLREPPVPPRAAGFLPESLVWHVALGVLRALAWLHEGIREELDEDAAAATAAARRTLSRTDDDWMPILHRAVEPRHIYFQAPRGVETYGPCKLGGLRQCYVSGSAHAAVTAARAPRALSSASASEERDDRGEPAAGRHEPVVVTARTGDPLLKHTQFWWEDGLQKQGNVTKLEKPRRPYTTGSDIFALGAALYRMMTGQVLPDPDPCHFCGCRHLDPPPPGDGCPHACEPDVRLEQVWARLTQYTAGLRETVAHLLRAHRRSRERAVEHYQQALDAYLRWKTSSPDGALHRDEGDDLVFRLRRDREENGETRLVEQWKDAVDAMNLAG